MVNFRSAASPRGAIRLRHRLPASRWSTRRGVDPAATGSQELAITAIRGRHFTIGHSSGDGHARVGDGSDQHSSGCNLRAKTVITTAAIHNFMAPVADFAEVLQQAPGTFSTNPNGIGLGQGKTFFRGFPDGDYTMQFDGIPLQRHQQPDAPFVGQLPCSVDQLPPFSITEAQVRRRISASPPTSAESSA